MNNAVFIIVVAALICIFASCRRVASSPCGGLCADDGKRHAKNKAVSESPEFVAALDKAILDDDWLVYCAAHCEEWRMSFQTWWSCAEFSEKVQRRFHEAAPSERIPSKDEIGERILELRKTHDVLYKHRDGQSDEIIRSW